MPSPFISVIVPVYKVEQLIQECIDSILAQNFTDFELILVDDGSPDNCGVICDQNAARDSRIRVIHQKNQGATRARANGVAAAHGEFITFVDGDDTIPKHAFSTLIAPANPDIDIVLGTTKNFLTPPKGELSADEYREACITAKSTHAAPWSKLFRRSLFNKEVFSTPRDIILGEDDIMNILLAYKVKGKVYSTHAIVYNYRKNPQSVTQTSQPLTELIKSDVYKLSILPKEDIERLLPKGLADRHISRWFNYSKYRVHIPRATHEYHRYLCSILKHTSIRYGLLGRILFFCTNPLIRAIIVPLYRLTNSLRGRH